MTVQFWINFSQMQLALFDKPLKITHSSSQLKTQVLHDLLKMEEIIKNRSVLQIQTDRKRSDKKHAE